MSCQGQPVLPLTGAQVGSGYCANLPQIMQEGGLAAAPGADDGGVLQGRPFYQIKKPFEFQKSGGDG